MDETELAYHKIHGRLSALPEEYCLWKKTSSDGRVVSKTLSGDYRPIFFFVHNSDLRNNLAELRMSFDYHHSLYKLHKPGLTFGWQHKLVLCQIIAGIYEGILLDLFEILTDKKPLILGVLAKQKLSNNNFGLGALIDIFSKANLIDSEWIMYLNNLNHLRNTIHPRSLNHPLTSFQENSVVRSSPEKLIEKLTEFVKMIKKTYS